MSTEVISLNHVWVKYNQTPVLEDINLTVYEGDFIGIIGPNGGGKTTLLKLILGLISPFQGNVKIMGRRVCSGRQYIGYVPQVLEFDQDFPVRVADVVKMGRLGKRRLLHRYNAKDEAIVNHSLEQVGIVELRNRPIGQLSGGQRQRVYIARALASEPRILLLDEPTASVDYKIKSSIYELLKDINQYITILLISHDIGEILTYVKSIGSLNRRLLYSEKDQLTNNILERTYQCPIDFIDYKVPYQILPQYSCPFYKKND
ncbi:metal ABC transporter ATP-binding protein [Cyanobacterium sp. uoEpiScrs1]|uniref:metal ABC transporter ATP-binding protein n=1 Tax=Cyanobacterium sp. uoEpiScrs1 TaxID=2976343 RepID=UPI00226AFC93|nr:ABC transporter ATP-binding protein [Cyanobacterium sp. uoEpiScrs1]